MDLPVRSWVLLVGRLGGWLAEQTARSAQRLSTCHGPTGFTITRPNPHVSLESAGDRNASWTALGFGFSLARHLGSPPSAILWLGQCCLWKNGCVAQSWWIPY
jgi:hypothetical protein